MSQQINTGTQAWTVEEVEGQTYITTTVRGVVYTVTQGRWGWEVASCRKALGNAMGGVTRHRSADEVAASRKALRDLPAVLDVIADGIGEQIDALAARAA
jgi:hypothetical protein